MCAYDNMLYRRNRFIFSRKIMRCLNRFKLNILSRIYYTVCKSINLNHNPPRYEWVSITEEDPLIKKVKYLFHPILINDGKEIAIRKRMFHRGYNVLLAIHTGNEIIYEHLITKNTLKEIEVFLYTMFGIEVKL